MPPKGQPVCAGCGKPIEGEYTVADKEDTFHDECFKCAKCGELLLDGEPYVVLTPEGEPRKFGYQKGVYYHPPCAKEVTAQPECATAKVEKPCCVCGRALAEEGGGLTMVDGTNLHSKCFKCTKCGKIEDTEDKATMRLLRTKIAQLKQGKYECESCRPPPSADGAAINADFLKKKEEAALIAEEERLKKEAQDKAKEERRAGILAAEDEKKQQERAEEERKEKEAEEAKQAKEDALAAMGTWKLEDLKDKAKCTAAGVPPGEREKFLSDADFEAAFGMTKEAYYALPKFKQTAAKKTVGLY